MSDHDAVDEVITMAGMRTQSATQHESENHAMFIG
jgi:hypothetical protein